MKDDKPVIYVVDDDPSVLRAIERLLRSVGYDVKTFPSALEFLKSRYSDGPGCLILDIRMPELDGLELQERLARNETRLPIIFITGHGTIPMSVQAMKAGAVDFLQKPFLEEDLLQIVSRAVAVDRQARRRQEELAGLGKRLKTLTPREYEVFGLITTGMLNKQVAYELGTSEKTIKVHRARIIEKLGARSLADLVRFADRLGVSSSRN